MIKPIYDSHGIKLFHYDCLKFLNISSFYDTETYLQLPVESVDCVCTDPPYGIQYYSNMYKYGNPHLHIQNDDQLFLPTNLLWSRLKNTGAMFAFFSQKQPDLVMDDRVKNLIVWNKFSPTMGDLTGDFGNQYELLAFMPKELFKLHSEKRYTNIWEFIGTNNKYHPTQKPVNLIARIIECSTDEGQLILDPFAGSGTSLLVARAMKRRAIGFEIEERHCETIIKRLERIWQGEMFADAINLDGLDD